MPTPPWIQKSDLAGACARVCGGAAARRFHAIGEREEDAVVPGRGISRGRPATVAGKLGIGRRWESRLDEGERGSGINIFYFQGHLFSSGPTISSSFEFRSFCSVQFH
jgi:hypothetical protein